MKCARVKRHHHDRRMLLGSAIAVVLTMTGCHMTNPHQPTGPSEATKAAANLKSLPSLEDTETQLHATIEQVGAKARSIDPTLTWRWLDEPSRAGCNPPYEKSEGELILMPKYVSDNPIPDESWSQVLAVARDAAAKLGATSVEMFHDEPGFHDVRFYNETGTALRIGTEKAALITGSTGCRLPRDQK